MGLQNLRFELNVIKELKFNISEALETATQRLEDADGLLGTLEETIIDKIRDEICNKYTTKQLLGDWTFCPKFVPEGSNEFISALVYRFNYFIEIDGFYYVLTIENKQWNSWNLCFLEEILVEYMINNGYFDNFDFNLI